MRKQITASVVGVALMLAGCGGGGDTTAAVETTYTGIFVDSPVDGLYYEGSLGSSGVTANGGQFGYKEGEVITFRAGNVIIGDILLTSQNGVVTPVDIIAYQRGTPVAINDPQVVAIVQTLMSADADGDPANGITIAPETVAVLEQKPPVRLDETQLDPRQIAEYLEEDEDEIVDETDAVLHLNETLTQLEAQEEAHEQNGNDDNDDTDEADETEKDDAAAGEDDNDDAATEGNANDKDDSDDDSEDDEDDDDRNDDTNATV